METSTQQEKAQRLLALHKAPPILVLANAWDVASARLIEDAGYPAIATTSAGIANALGYPDGQRISRTEMLEIVKRIVRSVQAPVSADVEAGYGISVDAAIETATAVLEAGAVGMNFEDSLDGENESLLDISLQTERIAAIRETSEKSGVHLVINARTDVFLNSVGEPGGRFDHAVRRANAYRRAGADSLFIPGVADRDTIARLAREVEGPLNVLASAGMPGTGELEQLGVARVSVGSGIMRAAMGVTRRIARELLDQGTYEGFTTGAVPYAEMNRLLTG